MEKRCLACGREVAKGKVLCANCDCKSKDLSVPDFHFLTGSRRMFIISCVKAGVESLDDNTMERYNLAIAKKCLCGEDSLKGNLHCEKHSRNSRYRGVCASNTKTIIKKCAVDDCERTTDTGDYCLDHRCKCPSCGKRGSSFNACQKCSTSIRKGKWTGVENIFEGIDGTMTRRSIKGVTIKKNIGKLCPKCKVRKSAFYPGECKDCSDIKNGGGSRRFVVGLIPKSFSVDEWSDSCDKAFAEYKKYLIEGGYIDESKCRPTIYEKSC